MTMIIPVEFYNRPTLDVAKELLGSILHHRLDTGVILSGIIVETEAYTQNDPACHAFKGKTPRSATLFGPCGRAYVYLIYGMYHCFNVVTEPEDTAGAVLIRALEPIAPLAHTHGPGRLCKSMQITKELNEVDLTDTNSPLFVTYGDKIPSNKLVTTTRIGIKLASDYKWRFYIKDNKHVSVK
ncbi:MAG: DNA-3-methyladenine glycosylase [Vampirovibrionia bacterium]